MLRLIQQFTILLTVSIMENTQIHSFSNNDEKGVTYAMQSAWAYSANL